ncbi:MAG: hypothetical protein LUE86_05020 [Clostridiales bacterium]|nr:hypothetical protein [Clostridiales bacterium]
MAFLNELLSAAKIWKDPDSVKIVETVLRACKIQKAQQLLAEAGDLEMNCRWKLTDEDSFQILRKLGDGVYELYQIQAFESLICNRSYAIAHDIIDVHDMGPEGPHDIMKAYGYFSIKQMKSIHGESTEEVLAVYRFELDAGNYDNLLSTRRSADAYQTVSYVKTYTWEDAKDMIQTISGYCKE